MDNEIKINDKTQIVIFNLTIEEGTNDENTVYLIFLILFNIF